LEWEIEDSTKVVSLSRSWISSAKQEISFHTASWVRTASFDGWSARI
jgi:hypothetical protein